MSLSEADPKYFAPAHLGFYSEFFGEHHLIRTQMTENGKVYFICDLADAIENSHKKLVRHSSQLRACLALPYIGCCYLLQKCGLNMHGAIEKTVHWVSRGEFSLIELRLERKRLDLLRNTMKQLAEFTSDDLEDYSI